nr:hypothetical protein [Nostoc sp. ChiSLP03a]MDZ8213010.1 hypothetical protein [Nostoc sp. ChiSLP03a]
MNKSKIAQPQLMYNLNPLFLIDDDPIDDDPPIDDDDDCCPECQGTGINPAWIPGMPNFTPKECPRCSDY